jgi:methyl-accepting chemotaxis protein
MFANLSIRAKLGLLSAVALLAMALVAVLSLREYREALDDNARARTRTLVEAAVAQVDALLAEEKAGKLTRAEAQERAKATLRPARYDGGNYYFVTHMDGHTLLNPTRPEIEGADQAGMRDAHGLPLLRAYVDVTALTGEGFIEYYFRKPGAPTTDPELRKIGYVKRVPEWSWIVGTGVYVDDLDAAFWRYAVRYAGLIGVVGLVVAGLSFALSRSLARTIGGIEASMVRLAAGDLQVAIPGAERRDEIGRMAHAVSVFKDAMAEAQRLRNEQEAQRRATEAERRGTLDRVAASFEQGMKTVVEGVTSTSGKLREFSGKLSQVATATGQQSVEVATASKAASDNIGAVAAAAEELSASIREITGQVSRSAQTTQDTVTLAKQAREAVEAMAVNAERIVDVVQLINQIAGQTNLLALNATIEGARAGEAGKGFAVVAAEVKSLASQTAKATVDIEAQIGEIRAVTDRAVAAIEGVDNAIGTVNGSIVAISAAIEEQGAATREIARSVQEVAASTTRVADNISGVSNGAEETGRSALVVKDEAEDLASHSSALRERVDAFLTTVRAA